ncbi:hypothetical protein KW844_28815, partial [Chitinophaga sp. sic0106]|nr:hypothetical protein [Chitinophaga sp. sic0106]
QNTYNLAGWQTSVNANYVNNGGSTGNWFGEVLSYDTGFTQSQYNGNIAGVLWKSGSDGVARAYGYRYDASGRLAGADFRQQNTTGASWTNDLVKYDVPAISYDANGNITAMTQWGMNGAAAQPIDILQYGYHNASNKLNYVTDYGQSLTQDFKEPVAGVLPDYQYDTTGSLIQDLNKGLSITYNHLHLPVHIEVSGKGTIDYVYDALGNKLRKTVQDNSVSPSRHIVRDYLPGAVYRQDSLELISTAEGRVRTVYRTGMPVGYVYDYFLKDHLGNVRTVLTEQTDFNMYVASMEEARAPMESQLFDNVDATRSAAPVGYPASDGKYVAKLNADGSHQKTGPAITLRVMAGDTISIGVNAFFKST